MAPGKPKWRRRKDARPGEIVAAALAVFAEKGFAAARLDDVARRAGVSKGALYLYFETKEQLFAAVVRDAVAPGLAQVRDMASAYQGSFAELVPMLLGQMARIAAASPLGGVIKMVIGEARNFPEIARVWHDTVVADKLATLSEVIARAQARGEIRPGDPRIHAISLISPLLMWVIWRETFVPVGAEPFDLEALAAQHVRTALDGLLVKAAA
jgi:AcrR family transcriptional regulator